METVGSLIDKISINELKIYHMNEQLSRSDISMQQKENFTARMTILKIQRDDLANELQQLAEDVLSGKRKLKIYRQLKMYNDKQFKD